MRAILWATFVLAVGAYLTTPLVDPDLWWHLTVGRWMLAHGTVPAVDYWNTFAAGEPWRAYSWLFEVPIAALDLLAGDRALMVTKLLLGVGFVGALSAVAGRVSRDQFFGLLVGVLAAAAAYNHFTLRPQTVVWILFALVLLQGHHIARDGFTARRGALVALLFALWANLHITTALGIAALIAWVMPRDLRDRDGQLRTLKTGSAAFIGTLCTPYLGSEWLTFLSKTSHPFQHAAIAEFQPATIMQYSTGLLAMLLVLLVYLLHLAPRAITVWRLIAVASFVLGGLGVVKFLPLAAVLVAIAIAEVWGQQGGAHCFGQLGEGIRRLEGLILATPPAGLAFVLICTVIVNVHHALASPVHQGMVPVGAVDFFEQHRLPRPLLNDFGRGGYLMYRFSDREGNPRHLVPIDGRTNVVPPEVWARYHAAETGKHNWREYLDLVAPRSILWRLESPFVSLLLSSGEWCIVYGDTERFEGHGVLVKRDWYQERSAPLPYGCVDTITPMVER